MVSIIVPAHNLHEYTLECIDFIVRYTEDYEVILIDNGSVPAYDCSKIKKETIKIIRNELNQGFPKSINQGIEISQGDLICILNNDSVVTPYWLSYLKEHIANGADLVGPMTNRISGPQQVRVPVYKNMDELAKVSKDFHEENYHTYQYFYRLVGFCLLFHRSVCDRIGRFDEQFGMGNFEDDDFCLRAVEAGFQLRIAKDVFVHHYGSMTHRVMDVEYNELLKKNSKLFVQKWGKKLNQLIKEDEYYGERSFK